MILAQAARPGHAAARDRGLNVPRFAAIGAAAMALLTTLCWMDVLWALIGCNHVYIGFFSGADPGSTAALIQGVAGSLAAGGLAGAAIATAWNALVRRRG